MPMQSGNSLFGDYALGRNPGDFMFSGGGSDAGGTPSPRPGQGGQVDYGPSGIPYYTPPTPGNRGGPSFVDQLFGQARTEAGRQQGAADRQYGRNAKEIDLLREFVGTADDRFRAIDKDTTGYLDSLMSGLGGMATDQMNELKGAIKANVQGARDRYGKEVGGIDKVVAEGMKTFQVVGDRAVKTAAGAITKFARDTQENVIQATVAGLRRGMDETRKMIAKGLGPDGNLMSPSERQEAARNLRFDVGMQTATMAAGVRQQTENTLAQLRVNLANVQLEADKVKTGGASLALQGEALKGEAASRLGQAEANSVSALLGGQEGQRAWYNMISGLGQFRSQSRQGTQLASLDFEMNGRLAIAQAVRDNPETVVGFLSALLAIGGVATAPGGMNIPALGGGRRA